MGATGSKGEDHTFERGSTLSLSSKRRSSKVDELQSITDTIQRIKDEIEFYNGTRTDPRYEECQKILADLSGRLQEMKKSGKRKSTVRVDEILDDIKVCFRLLEEKVNTNDSNEQNLDMASIESHSFINQNVNKFEQAKKPEFHGSMDSMISTPGYHPKKEKPKYQPISTIDLLEQQVENTEKEVKNAVQLEDTKQFIVLEKKIQILYTDLEMIHSDPHTPMSEKKETLEKRLIKCNNQIKKTKRGMERRSRTSSQIDGKTTSPPVVEITKRREVKSVGDPVSTEQTDDIAKILTELEEYQLKVQVFDGTKKDNDYKKLVGKLEDYWSKVYNIEEFSNIDRTRKIDTIDKIKLLIKKLEKKAEENGKILAAKAEINRIEDDLLICTKSINAFQGKKGDETYTSIDQNLRLLWDAMGRIDAEDPAITKRKNEIIDNIQEALKNLDERALQTVKVVIEPVKALIYQNVIDEDLIPHQLLKQTEEFQNHWNQLEHNLRNQKLKNKEQYQNILTVLENVSESLTFFINEHRSRIGVDTPQSTPNNVQNTKGNIEEQRAQFFNSMGNEPENLESKPLAASSIVSDIVMNNFILDTRNYKKPDLISSEKDLRIAVDDEESKNKNRTNVLAQVQRMRGEAKDFVKQINNSDVSDERVYLRFKNELRQLQDAIKSIDNDGTHTLSLHKTKTERYISDGLQKLEERRKEFKRNEEEKSKNEESPGKISVSKTLQDIMDIDANIQYLQKQIQKFEGITKDPAYTKIESEFLENQSKLLSIDINGYDNLRISKNEIIQQIGNYKKELEDKLIDNQKNFRSSNPNLANVSSEDLKKQVSHELKSVIEEVQKLKSQVERFSGLYKGIQYKQIEDSFKLAAEKLKALDSKGNDKIENAKVQTSQKIEQYLKILEDKSMKVNKVNPEEETKNETTTKIVTPVATTTTTTAPTDPNVNPLVVSFQQIEALRNKLVVIKESVESFEGAYKDSNYVKLENDLLACKQDINKIEDHGNASISTSKNQYVEYIDKLLKYFEDKMNIDTANSSWDRNPLEEMKETEKELAQLKKDIDKFDLDQGEEVLRNLDERLTKLIEKIESIDIGNLTNLRDHKNKILFDVQQTVNLLNDKASVMSVYPEELQQILREIGYVTHGVDQFRGTRYDKKYAELDEALIQLMMRVRSVDTRTSTAVADECVRTIQRIQELMKVLQEKVRIPGLDDKAPIVHNLGTFV